MEKKLLTLQDVRPPLSFNINYGLADINLRPRWLPIFDFDVWLPSKNMDLQRPLVWEHFQKEELVFSIFKNIKLPPISVLKTYRKEEDWKTRNFIYEVIDGKQRLTTLIAFINGEFSITWKHKQYFFEDLHPYLQSDFFNCITANIGYNYPEKPISDEDKIKWFEMINFAGTPQDIEHLKALKNEHNFIKATHR